MKTAIPLTWAALLTVALAIPFSAVPWSFIDTYNVFQQAIRPTWFEALTAPFGSNVEYRPLMLLTTKVLHQVVGLRIWFYKAVVLVQFALVLGLLIWLWRPVGTRRAVAACLALACFVGLHTSRILFLFVPINAHSLGLILLLVAAGLTIDTRIRPPVWVWFLLTGFALLLLETGVLIVPVLAVGWLLGAPGARGRAVGVSLAAVACYAAVRFWVGGEGVPSFYEDTGLGFSARSADELREIFSRAPWLLWLHNAGASLLSVVASEPRGGVWAFIASQLSGDTPAWRWLHVLSSLATTLGVVCSLRFLGPPSQRDRYLIGIGTTLLLCGSALGFLYTRDRIGLTAGTGYSMLVYVATATALGWGVPRQVARRVVTGVVVLVSAAWLLRDVEAYMQIRDRTLEHRLEWTTRYESLRQGRSETDLMLLLRNSALRSTPPDPRAEPAWMHQLFERRVSRSDSP